MSNKSLQYAECTACKTAGKETTSAVILNGAPANNSTGWLTIWGPLTGTAFNLPATTVPGNQNVPTRTVPISPAHFCPACVTTLGIDKVQAAITAAVPAK